MWILFNLEYMYWYRHCTHNNTSKHENKYIFSKEEIGEDVDNNKNKINVN